MIINVYGSLSKDGLVIAIGQELTKHGTVLILTNNPIMTYLPKERSYQYTAGNVNVIVKEDIKIEDINLIKQDYSYIIIDTFEPFLGMKLDRYIEIFDDISIMRKKEILKADSVRIGMLQNDIKRLKKEYNLDYVIDNSKLNRILLIKEDTVNIEKQKYQSFVVGTLLNISPKEYLNSYEER